MSRPEGLPSAAVLAGLEAIERRGGHDALTGFARWCSSRAREARGNPDRQMAFEEAATHALKVRDEEYGA